MGAFNGSGLFVRTYNWVTDKINGVNITASRVDTEDDGFAAGLSNCVTRDGQGKMGADFVPATDATFNLGSPSARWQNINASGNASVGSVIEVGARILATADRTITNTITAAADTALQLVPGVPAAYEVEARLLFVGDVTSTFGGISVGLFATNINFNSGFINCYGTVFGANTIKNVATWTAANLASYFFPRVTSGSVGPPSTPVDWLLLKGTMNILNFTGSPLIGVTWAQNTATGGTLVSARGGYLKLTRLS